MTKLVVHPNAAEWLSGLQLPGAVRWTPDIFEAFCQLNPECNAELDSQGNVIIMPPANADADGRNFDLTGQLRDWIKTHPAFKGFGPSAGFTLSNNAVRSPDATLVRREDWDKLTKGQQKSFAPVPLYFVIEIRSSDSDSRSTLEEKMQEYMSTGTQLGWLIDPETSTLTVYRPGSEPETHHAPESFPADEDLPGLVIDFIEIW